jgi:predicted DNA-binding protein (MmcQ/YjbR family)
MNLDWIRAYCLSLPHVTESMPWEESLVFKIGGKMFAIASLNPARDAVSLKADPEEFDQLIEHPAIVPAPYLARAKWIQVQRVGELPRAELQRLLLCSYKLVKAKLSKRLQSQIGGTK